MERLFGTRTFADFGPDRLGVLPAKVQLIEGARSGQLRRQVRELGPRLPGVYGMLDAQGELIYVGKAKSLRARLLSYFRPRSRDPKAGRILRHTARIAWEVSPCEFAALHREMELIRRWRPRFNVVGQPNGWRYTYLCLGRAPAPYAFLSRRPPAQTLARYGPLRASQRAADAVRRLNDWFALRDCPQTQEMIFADELELFPLIRSPACLRHEIGTCLGPCAAACTQAGYQEAVQQARAFLDGESKAPLRALRRQMDQSASEQNFERAAVLRDKLHDLGWLAQHLEQLRELQRDGSFIYPIKSASGVLLWYLVREGCVMGALLAPQNPDARRKAVSLLQRVYRKNHAEASAEQIESLLLVAAWFRRRPNERRRTLQPAAVLKQLNDER